MRGPEALVVAVVTLAPTVAWAGERARLELSRAPGTEACPDEKALSDAVASRLGYEPFADDADLRLTVRFGTDRASGLRAEVAIQSASGDANRERVLTSTARDCQELAAAVTLTVSILLDPRSGLARHRPPAPPVVPAVRTIGPAPVSPPVSRPPADTTSPALRVRFVAHVTGSVGLLPAATFGAIVGAGIDGLRWSADAEFRIDASASGTFRGFSVSGSFVGGELVPCVRLGPARACAVVAIGATRAAVSSALSSEQSAPTILLGPRAGIAWPLSRWLSLDAHADLLFAPTETTVREDGHDLWSTSAVSGLLGVGAVGFFP